MFAIPKSTELTIYYERRYDQIHNSGDFIGDIHIESSSKKYIFYDIENVSSRCREIIEQIAKQAKERDIIVNLKNTDDACFTLFDEKYSIQKA